MALQRRRQPAELALQLPHQLPQLRRALGARAAHQRLGAPAQPLDELAHLPEQRVLVLVVERVRVAHALQRGPRLQRREHDLVLALAVRPVNGVHEVEPAVELVGGADQPRQLVGVEPQRGALQRGELLPEAVVELEDVVDGVPAARGRAAGPLPGGHALYRALRARPRCLEGAALPRALRARRPPPPAPPSPAPPSPAPPPPPCSPAAPAPAPAAPAPPPRARSARPARGRRRARPPHATGRPARPCARRGARARRRRPLHRRRRLPGRTAPPRAPPASAPSAPGPPPPRAPPPAPPPPRAGRPPPLQRQPPYRG
mmetsp:Transcript_23374/g.79514  ORF Transcript_23374/g.79514 Transcript_23374/m.79514 type:complete len:316 (-) Transcript_23374:232-1179(-)